MNAELLLLDAARLIRERAEMATPGLWEIAYGGIYVGAKRENIGISYQTLVLEIADDDDDAPNADDAEHMASWQPGVALAVADWLEKTADGLAARGVTARLKPAEHSALAVARAYMGEQA